ARKGWAGRGHGARGDPATIRTSLGVVDMKHPGRPALSPYAARLVAKAAKKLGLAWDLFNPRVLDAVDAAAFAFCRETLATATKDLGAALEDLRGLLRAGLPRGDALSVLARSVRQVFADPFRAFRIAATESSRLLHAGQLASARDLGA